MDARSGTRCVRDPIPSSWRPRLIVARYILDVVPIILKVSNRSANPVEALPLKPILPAKPSRRNDISSTASIMAANQSIFGLPSNPQQGSFNITPSGLPVNPVSVNFNIINLGTGPANTSATRWFDGNFPAEIRNVVYGHLWGDVIVIVDGSKNRPVRIRPRASLAPQPLNTQSPPSALVNTRAWLRISKQFFYEARWQLWHSMEVKFERRWDLIHARLNRSLDPRPPEQFYPAEPPTGFESLTIFPFEADIFSKIREFHVNMSTFSDFRGRVSTPEGERVAAVLLSTVTHHMPNLKKLSFKLDERSKIAAADDVFLPEVWFLEKVVRLTNRNQRLRVVKFDYGPGFSTGAFAKQNGRFCVIAMDYVFDDHVCRRRQRLDYGGRSGVPLRYEFGRRMLQHMRHIPHMTAAFNLLFLKVQALMAPQPL
ncbi:hypothetical protein H2198_007310 [Neophaeococcomyces mojaviensis]|uniref:Uncharacterized protein n=1 Tax=Neophaeococcomyces mojaviensis TaxID=3383035 RepID=A0ACC3A0G8_9EURO|nr:hypothetical protein H2198_007310 [Knufia sp. JES_112]